MTVRGGGARAYARAVQRAVEAQIGRPSVLSPRDWAYLSDWFARGVPLDIVFDALSEATRPRRSPRRLSLGHLAPAVEEAHRAWVEGKAIVRDTAESPLPSREEVQAIWSAAAARCGERLKDAIEGSTAILRRGGDAERADDALDDALPGCAPPGLSDRARAEAGRALAPFRGRMSAPAFEETLRRAVADRLRRLLGLPRVALTRPPLDPGDRGD